MTLDASSYLGQYWPVTQDFGLIQAPLEVVRPAFLRFWAQTGQPLTGRDVTGGLGAALDALTPLNRGLTRKLWIAGPNGWTAFFQNGVEGSEPAAVLRPLARSLGVRAMRLCRRPGGQGARAATRLEVYAPQTLGGDAQGIRRIIAAEEDAAGTWQFANSGAQFRFEDETTGHFKARAIRDRFTPEMLGRAVTRLIGSELSDAAFTATDDAPAHLFELAAPKVAQRDYSLFDVMSGLPWAEE